MVYRFTIISDEVDDFVREIQIDSEATFFELHEAILKAAKYNDDQMTSFYVCDDEWERGQQITREDVSEPGHEDEDLYVMANTRLSEFIEDEEQKFEYVFDPFSERVFYLDVKELIPGENLDAPVLLRSKGEAPQQVEELDLGFVPTTGKGSDFFDEDEASEFYGDGDFNSDDLDLEGFEYSDGGEY